MKYSIETKEVGAGWNGDSGFRFRLVGDDGESQIVSGWARYDQVAFLDYTAAVSPYYTDHSEIIIVNLEQAMEYIAIGQDYSE